VTAPTYIPVIEILPAEELIAEAYVTPEATEETPLIVMFPTE
jgi:hypothetical protein